MIKHIQIACLLIPLVYGGGAYSQGALDWADPCVKQEKTFDSSAAAARARADEVVQSWDSRLEPPGEARGFYVEAIREGGFKAWSQDPATQPLLKIMKDKDSAFDDKKFFMNDVYPKVVTQEKEAEYVRALFKADYQGKIRPTMMAQRKELENDLVSKKKEVDDACKPNVVNQILRATLGNMAIMVNSNWEAAKNEKGDIAKFYRGMTGISLTDIQKYGLQGGPNSEMNKLLGGEKSAARELIKAMDPGNWKINVSGSGPVFEGPKIGDVRVCFPWC